MLRTELTFPEIGLIAGTRGMAGAGLGLLAADRFTESQRKAIGWTLFAVGAITTIPLVLLALGHRQTAEVQARRHRRFRSPMRSSNRTEEYAAPGI
jgi:hypothetical protein